MGCWMTIERKATGYRKSVRGDGGSMEGRHRWPGGREQGRRWVEGEQPIGSQLNHRSMKARM